MKTRLAVLCQMRELQGRLSILEEMGKESEVATTKAQIDILKWVLYEDDENE